MTKKISKPLFVPIYVDALVVNRQPEYPFKSIALEVDDLTRASNAGLGSAIEPGIKDKGGPNKTRTKKEGVHLHWHVPRGFRHGVYNRADNSWDFPLVPNRWLVIRTDDKMNMKKWVIESDLEDTQAKKREYNWIKTDRIGTMGGGTPKYKFTPVKIGKVHDLSTGSGTWKDHNPSPMFLTIMATGNPDFSTSYLSCKDVFGFHDDLKGVPDKANLSYRVFGWYSDASKDPLAAVKNEADLKAKLEDLSWVFDDKNLKNNQIPDRILCYGTIFQLDWDSGKTFDNVPSISTIELGIGNSTSEALAVLLSKNININQTGLADNLLKAFQYHSLKENGLQKDWRSSVQYQTHKSGFISTSSGKEWVIEKKEKKNINNAEEAEIESPVPFSNTISDLLLELNTLQRMFDRKADNLSTLQQQLYALNYKKKFAWSKGAIWGSITPARKEELRKDKGVIDQEIIQLTNMVTGLAAEVQQLKVKKPGLSAEDMESEDIDTFNGQIAGKCEELNNALRADASMKDVELKEIPLPAFFEPKDPVIVIDGLNPSEKYTGKEHVICRTINQFAEIIRLEYGGKSYHLETDQLFNDTISVGPDGVTDIFVESLLFDPNSSRMLAVQLITNAGNLDKTVEEVTDEILKLDFQADRYSRKDKTPAIVPPPFCMNTWTQPWTPMYLEWEVSWKSTYDEYTTASVFKNWAFNGQNATADFQFSDKGISANSETYRGRTILSHDLIDQVSQLEEKLGADLFSRMRPMSQKLSGLGDQLLMRKSGLEFPLLDKDTLETMDAQQYIGQENLWHPIAFSEAFHPFRGGVFSFNFIRVIDTFGQVLEIIDPDRDQSTEPPDNPILERAAALSNYKDNQRFLLPPRLLQPSRLRFDWLSAQDDHRLTDSDPGTNPVCGWLLHDKMDNTIVVFDGDGTELGELAVTGSKVEFNTPPGVAAPDIKNDRLKKLIEAIKSSTDAYYGIFQRLHDVSKKSSLKSSQQSLGMTLPTGIPVAVVSARCVLEIKGLPAEYQYWESQNVSNQYLQQVQFKAYLGEDNSRMDGLLGFFKNQNYHALNLPMNGKKGTNNFSNYYVANTPLSLTMDQEQEITLLMDPRMSVKVSCGILPAASYELPIQFTAAALQAIKQRFLVAPILTPVDALEMPLPKTPGTNWIWTSIGKEGPTHETPKPSTPENLNFRPLRSIEGWLTIIPKKDK